MKNIKAQRIRWLGHVKRMEARAMPRRIIEGQLFTGRRKGIPRLRWIDDVVADLRVMKTKQWTWKAMDREQLRRPRLTQGCSARRIDGWMDGTLVMLHKITSSRPRTTAPRLLLLRQDAKAPTPLTASNDPQNSTPTLSGLSSALNIAKLNNGVMHGLRRSLII